MRKLGKVLLCFGLAAQALVPGWMSLKRHLILTRGERVTLDVTLHDPRDLFMGHYVRLSARAIPPALEGVPRNYLRYYCDQRYARALEDGLSQGVPAELDVRVWRGSALAEALRIEGVPAYTYVERTQAAQTPAPKRPEGTFRCAWLPLSPPRALNVAFNRALAHRLREEGYTHLRVPVNETEVWRYMRKMLGMPTGHPLTPCEVSARREMMRSMALQWGRENEVRVLPLFQGTPFPCTKPFVSQAAAYYMALRETCGVGIENVALEGFCGETFDGKTLWEAAQRAFPKAELLLHGTAVPEGVPPERVILVLPALPEVPPVGVRWMVAGEAPEPLPEGCVGQGREIEPIPPLVPSRQTPAALLGALRERNAVEGSDAWRKAFVETFAALALERYAKTGNPEARRLANDLLMCSEEHTLWAYFNRCETYADYCDFVRWLREAYAKRRPVALGGWPQAEASPDAPPEPPKPIVPTAKALLSLGEAVLAL